MRDLSSIVARNELAAAEMLATGKRAYRNTPAGATGIKTETYTLPDFWLCPLINGDYSGLEPEDIAKLEAFTVDMIARHGKCWAVGTSEEQGFMRYHDAERWA